MIVTKRKFTKIISWKQDCFIGIDEHMKKGEKEKSSKGNDPDHLVPGNLHLRCLNLFWKNKQAEKCGLGENNITRKREFNQQTETEDGHGIPSSSICFHDCR